MKSNTKAGIKIALVWASFVAVLIGVGDKIGLHKWKTYESPISWNEFIHRIPFYFGFGLVTFLVVFFWWIDFRREPKYCIHCKILVQKSVSDDSICPLCNSSTEPLDGVFERHPELKR